MTSLCFSCPLPDCDEASPRCAVKQGRNRYRAAKGRDPASISEVDRAAYSEFSLMWKIEHAALRSEARS